MGVLLWSARRRPSLFRSGLAAAVLLAALAAGSRAEAQVQQGARWEGQLTSKTSWAANDPTPYRDVKVLVTFTQGSQSFQTHAFWRTGKTFSFRAAFHTTGTWSWSTQCLQPTAVCNNESFSGGTGLHNASGSVTVQAYNSGTTGHVASNLYIKGMVQTVASTATTRAYFRYSKTQEKFQWLGDTAWSAPIRATPTQWTQYIQRLSTAGFTVVQIATPVDYMDGSEGAQPGPLDAPSLKPFACSGSEPTQLPHASCWMNNDYWNRFDNMVKAANDKGIVVVVVGLMERVVEKRSLYPDLASTKTFARTLASRLAGSHVIFSPAFDRSPRSTDDTTCASTPPTCMEQRIRTIGAEIRDATHNGTLATPSSVSIRQLIANHSAGSDSASDLLKFQNDSWLSFYLFQSGQAANLAKDAANQNGTTPLAEQHRLIFERAATFPPPLAAKPNVNAELIYEGVEAPCALCPNNCNAVTKKCIDQATYAIYYTAGSQRKGLWMSFFNGAVGGTIGVTGTWNWTGNGLASSTSQSWVAVKRLKAFLDLTNWTMLRPSASRLQAQTLQAWQKIYAIENTGRTEVAVYFPERIAAGVRVTDLPQCRTAHWFDPRTENAALRTATPQSTCTGNFCSYYPPAGGDWILLFRQVPCLMTANSLSVTAGSVAVTEDETGWALFGQKLDAQGEPIGEAAKITDAQIGASPKRIRLVENPGGMSLVAWESEDPVEGTPARILALRLDSDGNPVGDPIPLGTSTEDRAADPAITGTPGGGFVVAWSTLSDEGDEVHAQMIDSHGEPGADATVAVLTAADPVEPMVSADANGDLAVAWSESSETDSYVAVRRLDAEGQPLGTVNYPIMHLEGSFDSLSSLELAGGVLDLTWSLEDAGGVPQGVFACGFGASFQPTGDVLTVWAPEGMNE